MYPTLFAFLAANAPLQGLLGVSPFRLYPAGEAPQDTSRPYCTWQIIGGNPLNYLGARPDMDKYSIQIDAYAPSVKEVRDLVTALRNAVELRSHVVSFRGEAKEADTRLIRSSFDLEWFETIPAP